MISIYDNHVAHLHPGLYVVSYEQECFELLVQISYPPLRIFSCGSQVLFTLRIVSTRFTKDKERRCLKMKVFSTTTLLLAVGAVNAVPFFKGLAATPNDHRVTLSIMAFHTGEQCDRDNSFWYLSTGTDTWFNYLEKTNGCQAINATWGTTSVKPMLLAEGCEVTVYTDTACKDGEAAVEFEKCASEAKEWKSWALRGCTDTERQED
ncbi:hypothetical protein QBC35DRAFT_505083 [Podospora australis]|uniref:Uncharacterized protein n=1 Tax=Podospora australis TaxID=1536484 RepID=A0AAN6WP09_9PEZI|nr:hypothetical protein QBC35DRAFT_505083 [Podospora australis]